MKFLAWILMEVELCQRVDFAQDLKDVAGTAGTVHMSERCLKETHETPRQVEVVSQEPYGGMEFIGICFLLVGIYLISDLRANLQWLSLGLGFRCMEMSNLKFFIETQEAVLPRVKVITFYE